jgi:hypothetical protein
MIVNIYQLLNLLPGSDVISEAAAQPITAAA